MVETRQKEPARTREISAGAAPVIVRRHPASVSRRRNRMFGIVLALAAIAAFTLAIGTTVALHYSLTHHHAFIRIL
jgi:hypothetical protein